MPESMDSLKIQIKTNIKELITQKKYEKAQQLLSQYVQITSDDLEAFSIQSVIYIQQGDFLEARNIIVKGLAIDNNSFDLLFNLAYVFEQLEDFPQTYKFYKKAKESCTDATVEEQINKKLNNLESKIAKKDKLIFFIKHDINSFVDDIVEELSYEYETRFVKVTDLKQIDEGMKWADICWFEWCDELIGYGSGLPVAKEKKLICRLHRYEAFSNYIENVTWSNVDNIIFVAKHIQDIVRKKANIPLDKCTIINNGVNFDRFPFVERRKGFNLAWIGYINLRKNPMLVIQYFNELVKKDKRYQLYFAGSFQDEALLYYIQEIIQKLNLQKNIHFDGFINNAELSSWLKDKNYVVTGSIAEGHPVGVLEAMASGLKPVIHYFPGADSFYPKGFIYHDLGSFMKIFNEDEYDSYEYKNFIKENYSLEKQMEEVRRVISTSGKIESISKTINSKYPLVTIGVINYNQSAYIDECLTSILRQDYPNVEILIVDDCSTDDSINIIKRYTSQYNYIKLIKHDNNSGSGSKGVQDVQIHSKGKYFTFIDADDYYPNANIISSLVLEAEKNNEIDFVFGDFSLVDNTGKKIDVWKYKELDGNTIITSVFQRLGSGIIPMIGLYKKSFYKDRNLKWYYDQSLKIGYDTINCLLNIKNGWKIRHINKEILCYRRHSNNITSNPKERIHCTITLAEYIVKNFAGQIYFPEVKWNILDNRLKKATKMYFLGLYFYEAYKHYSKIDKSTLWDFNGNADLLNTLLFPLEKKIEYYFNKSLEITPHYNNEIAKLRKELSSLKTVSISQNSILPKVSIIIPTYNQKEYLREAIDSALVQDYENLEILVSDDCSTDGTDILMKNYSNEKRIKYIKNPKNLGPGVNTCNVLYNHTDAKYVLILNHDDFLIKNDYISKAVNFFLTHSNISFVWANVKILDVKTDQYSETKYERETITNGKEYFINYGIGKYTPVISVLSSLFDRNMAISAGCFKEKAFVKDLFLYLKLMLMGDVGFINDCVGVYRQHKNSITHYIPIEKDYTNIEELINFKTSSWTKEFSEESMTSWVKFRIFKYVYWRLTTLILDKDEKNAIMLLNGISNRYPQIFKDLVKDLRVAGIILNSGG